jgi:hypothetical protein
MGTNSNIDAVIMFVDMNDIEWRNRYDEYVKTHEIPIPEINNVEVRSRDYGTLKCLIRSIEKNIPWINNVFLVVQSESQVPKWVNRETVKVVLHEDFIPKEFLPLYNTFTIQTHLHLIHGLSEKFLCISDDSIITQPMYPTDFFLKDKIVQCIVINDKNYIKNSSSKHSHLFKVGASEHTKKICGVKNDYYYQDDHSIQPMLKSINNYVYNKIDNIHEYFSAFREVGNVFKYTFLTFTKLTRKCIMVPSRSRGVSFHYMDMNKFRKWVKVNQGRKQISVNDQDLNPLFDKELFYKMVEETLYQLFPNKSQKYEL